MPTSNYIKSINGIVINDPSSIHKIEIDEGSLVFKRGLTEVQDETTLPLPFVKTSGGNVTGTLTIGNNNVATLLSGTDKSSVTTPTTGMIYYNTSDSSVSYYTGSSWNSAVSLPDQTSNSGKVLTTNGSTASWGDLTDLIDSSGSGDSSLLSNYHSSRSYTHTVTATDVDREYIELTTDEVPDVTGSYTMTVYRNGLLMALSSDYTFDSTNRRLTNFSPDLQSGETVVVVIGILDTNVSTYLNLNHLNKIVEPNASQISSSSITLSTSEVPTNENYLLSVFKNGMLLTEGYDYTYSYADKIISFETSITSNDLFRIIIDSAGRHGQQYLNNTRLTGVTKVDAIVEKYQNLGTVSSGTITIDADDGTYAYIIATGNINISLTCSTSVTNGLRTLSVAIAHGSYVVSWGNNITWDGGSAPDFQSDNSIDIVSFVSFDNGTNWYGVLTGAF